MTASLSRSLRLLTPSLARSANGHIAPNRRGEIRRLARFACRVRRPNCSRLVADRTLDLSPQGMLILSDEAIDAESHLVVSFRVTDFSVWIDANATVTRIIEGRRLGDAGRALGLRFDALPAVSRLILRGNLRKLPPTVAQREPPRELTRKPVDYADDVRRVLEGD